MTIDTTNPPDLGIKGWLYLFMSVPTSFVALADLIHLFVRNRVKTKLRIRIIPTRVNSVMSTNRKSMKLVTRLMVRKVVTTDSKEKNVKTAILINPVSVFSD